MLGDGLVGRLTGSGSNDRRKSSLDGNMKKRMVTQAAVVESFTFLQRTTFAEYILLRQAFIRGRGI